MEGDGADRFYYNTLTGESTFNKPTLEAGKGWAVADGEDIRTAVVPSIVSVLIEIIEEGDGINLEGIYRVNGDAAAATSVREAFGPDGNGDDGEDSEALAKHRDDPTIIASALKGFLAHLEDPLFGFDNWDAWVAMAALSSADEKREEARRIIRELPLERRMMLGVLMRHLLEVDANESENRMGAHNLATVLAPTLLRSRDDAVTFTKAKEAVGVVECVMGLDWTASGV